MSDKLIELTRRKALLGLGAIGAAGAGAGMGTSALFSDEESFSNNSIQAGTLDLTVDVSGTKASGKETGTTPNGELIGSPPEPASFSIGDVKPGDGTSSPGTLEFTPNISDNPGWLWMSGQLTEDAENGRTEPEKEVDSSSNAGELADAIYVDIKIGSTYLNNPADYTLADLLKQLESGFLVKPDTGSGTQPFSSGQGDKITIEWSVPADVGNEIQSDKVKFDLQFAAVQSRNNPNPNNPFADTTVYPSDDLASAVSSASSGDTISVFGQGFSGAGSSNYGGDVTISQDDLTLAKASTEDPTIGADAQVNNRAITVDGATGVTIDGLDITFSGGAGSSPNAEKYAIEVRAGSDDLTVCNCTIRDIVTDEDGRDGSGGTTDVNAVRSTGITIKSELGGTGSTVSAPTIRHNTLKNIECTGSTTQDGILDSDSRAKGIALVGDVSDAVISSNDIVGIGTASNDPSGAQISTVNASSASYTTSPSDNKAAEGTDKPRGITIIQGGGSAAPTDFVIENNVLGGTGSDAIVGVYGQPAIFIGGSGGIGTDHDVRDNEIYHPVDNLNGAEALALNGDNTWYDTGGNSQSPSLRPPDQDVDGGNLINRASGANYSL